MAATSMRMRNLNELTEPRGYSSKNRREREPKTPAQSSDREISTRYTLHGDGATQKEEPATSFTSAYKHAATLLDAHGLVPENMSSLFDGPLSQKMSSSDNFLRGNGGLKHAIFSVFTEQRSRVSKGTGWRNTF